MKNEEQKRNQRISEVGEIFKLFSRKGINDEYQQFLTLMNALTCVFQLTGFNKRDAMINIQNFYDNIPIDEWDDAIENIIRIKELKEL
jgi:hypothetical protein